MNVGSLHVHYSLIWCGSFYVCISNERTQFFHITSFVLYSQAGFFNSKYKNMMNEEQEAGKGAEGGEGGEPAPQ